jgi:hypothetical protein
VRKRYHSLPPDPAKLAEALRGVFGKLAGEVFGKLKDFAPTSNTLDYRAKSIIGADAWEGEMKQTLSPVVRMYLEEGYTALLSEIGFAPLLPVQRLDEAVNRAVLSLAKSTHDTTSLSVDEAIEATREAIRQGLNAGEAHDVLKDRLKDIFTDLSDNRAVLIANTESSRAKHQGELLAIDEAGLEARKVWLPDSMACELCKGFARMGGIPLDKDFGKIGSGPYSTIAHPPGHPQCRCSLQYDLSA